MKQLSLQLRGLGVYALFLTGCSSDARSTDPVSTGGGSSNENSGGDAGLGARSTGGGAGDGGSSGSGPNTGGQGNSGAAASAGGVTGETTGGSDTGAGGSTHNSGEPVCGTTAEDQAVRLTCPEGQVIDAVEFASFGTPTGECESFVKGDCHAETSESQVEELCAGRATCTVVANNGTFGDPCNRVTKSLSVQVSCADGVPIIEDEPYKGVANSPAKEIAELGASWCYNWTGAPSSSDCGAPLFVPMIWGGGDVAAAIKSLGKGGYETVLTFNEPNKSDQANMSVAAAIALWPEVTSDPNIRVSSPAVSDDGRAWLEDFMTQVKTQGLRVDFIAMHWYGWNAGSCTSGNLQGAVNWASQWGLPVWITEFGCMGSSNTDEATLIKFFNDSIVMLAGHPLVERYAWYPWNDYNHLYLPDGNDVDQRTALGDAFLAAPASR